MRFANYVAQVSDMLAPNTIKPFKFINFKKRQTVEVIKYVYLFEETQSKYDHTSFPLGGKK